MKKTSIVIVSMFLMLIIAGPALADVQTIAATANTNAQIDDPTGRPNATATTRGITNIDLSPNVALSYNGAADEYEMTTYNNKGTMQYGRFSGDTNIYTYDLVEPGTAMQALTATDGSTFQQTGWEVLGGGTTGS